MDSSALPNGTYSTDLFPVSLLCESQKERKSCGYVCCCTSCAVGDLAVAHEEGTFCCAGNWRGACCLYGTLNALPVLGLAYVLGPATLVFCLPAAGLFRWPYACCIRCQLRSKYTVLGNCCTDFLCAYFCESCTISQELREAEIQREAVISKQPEGSSKDVKVEGGSAL